MYTLKQFKAIVPCDNTLHYFVLQDINVDNFYLKVKLNDIGTFLSVLFFSNRVIIMNLYLEELFILMMVSIGYFTVPAICHGDL